MTHQSQWSDCCIYFNDKILREEADLTPYLLQAEGDFPKKTGLQQKKSYYPVTGGRNETYTRIDPVRVVMFKFVRLRLGKARRIALDQRKAGGVGEAGGGPGFSHHPARAIYTHDLSVYSNL